MKAIVGVLIALLVAAPVVAVAQDVKEKGQSDAPMQMQQEQTQQPYQTQPNQPQAQRRGEAQPMTERGQPDLYIGPDGAWNEPTQAVKTTQAMKGKEVTGRVKSWDLAKGIVTLEDGTTLKLPTGATTDYFSTGADIRASYEDKGGEKVITDVRVMQQ